MGTSKTKDDGAFCKVRIKQRRGKWVGECSCGWLCSSWSWWREFDLEASGLPREQYVEDNGEPIGGVIPMVMEHLRIETVPYRTMVFPSQFPSPTGWKVFGTYAGLSDEDLMELGDAKIEFSDAVDQMGLPLWERLTRVKGVEGVEGV